MREFETGATRNVDESKFDYEGFLSPLVLRRFGEYMHENRVQADGTVRDSDNWQKGIPLDSYMKSGWRHFFDLWLHHRGLGHLAEADLERTLCAVIFNAQGYLHETLKPGLAPAKPNESEKCSDCGRDLHGYRGPLCRYPLCRYCAGTAE